MITRARAALLALLFSFGWLAGLPGEAAAQAPSGSEVAKKKKTKPRKKRRRRRHRGKKGKQKTQAPAAEVAPAPKPAPVAKPVAKPGPVGPQRIVFLHHSTGQLVWEQGVPTHYRAMRPSDVLEARSYPDEHYPRWENRPQTFYELWVQQPGAYQQATLKRLTDMYDVIVFKHCYTHDWMWPSQVGRPDGTENSLKNYKAAYQELKKAMRAHPDTKFVVWTVAASTRDENRFGKNIANQNLPFYKWVTERWDEPGDNIFVFDFRKLETRSQLDFLADVDATSAKDSHPNKRISAYVAPLFANRLRHIVENRGDQTSLTGQ